jgi:hypothetical protein
MTTLDADALFVKLDKLRERMTRLEQFPDEKEWQFTRLLIAALKEGIIKSKYNSAPVARKIRLDAPEAVQGEWRELVEALSKKGIKAERRSKSEAKSD